MLSTVQKSLYFTEQKNNMIKASPLVIQLSRKDFHTCATSLTTQDANSLDHLKELVNGDVNQVSSKSMYNPMLENDRIQYKYDISSKVFNYHSEKSFLETIEFAVNDWLPVLTETFVNNNNQGSTISQERKNAANLSYLCKNLLIGYKKTKTEVNILKAIDNQQKKSIVQSDSNSEENSQNSNMSLKKAFKKKFMAKVPKNQCCYEKCHKEYSTKGALSYHIKTKHKNSDKLKKEFFQKENKEKQVSVTKVLLNKTRNSSVNFCSNPKNLNLSAKNRSKLEKRPCNLTVSSEMQTKIIIKDNSKENEDYEDSMRKSTMFSTTAFTTEINEQVDHLDEDLSIKDPIFSNYPNNNEKCEVAPYVDYSEIKANNFCLKEEKEFFNFDLLLDNGDDVSFK